MHSQSKIVFAHGLKRSGNHAVINWILEQSELAFFNNAIPVKAILKGKKKWPRQSTYTQWIKYQALAQSIKNFAPSIYKTAVTDNRALVSFEDIGLDYRFFAPRPEGSIDLLILRDPQNLFASRIKKAFSREWLEVYPRENNKFMQRATQLWKQHAKEALGQSSFLEKPVVVFFDSWIGNEDYRQNTAHELGLSIHSEQSLEKTAHYGGGSSFSEQGHDSSAVEILNRSASLAGEEENLLHEIMQDEELIELRTQIIDRFGYKGS